MPVCDPSQLPLTQTLSAFITDCQARGLSERTIDLYASELGGLLVFLGAEGARSLLAVSPDHLRRYLLRLGETRNAGGVHVAYRVARTFLRWAWLEFDLDAPNPIARVKAPKVPQEPLDPLRLSDLRAMLATCERRTFTGDRDRAAMLALLDTGARASEFTGLDVGDVNQETGAVLIRQGKGGKSRVTFLGAKTRRELGRYLRHRGELEPSAPLWVTEGGARLTYHGLRSMVRRRAKAAGVPAPGLHSFRRAFALLSLRGGVDLVSLQRLMGHADLSVIRRYLAQSEDDLRAAHAKGGPVDHNC